MTNSTPRHAAEQAIAADLALCDLGEGLTRGRARSAFRRQRAACLAQVRAWNAEDGVGGLTDDELLAALAA
jgi:hypothetical protein